MRSRSEAARQGSGSDGAADAPQMSRAERAEARKRELEQAPSEPTSADTPAPHPEVTAASRREANREAVRAARFDVPASTAGREGDRVLVTIGKQILYPVKYNGFEVGPLSLEVQLDPGETFEAAYQRARLVLAQLFEAEYDLQLRAFKDRLEHSRQSMKED